MEPTENALDAYSQVVSGVAELLPRVAAIRVRRRGRSGGVRVRRGPHR